MIISETDIGFSNQFVKQNQDEKNTIHLCLSNRYCKL
jgi:hypothetical protein